MSNTQATLIKETMTALLQGVIDGDKYTSGLCCVIDTAICSIISDYISVEINFSGWDYFSGSSKYPVLGEKGYMDSLYPKTDGYARYQDETIKTNMYTGFSGGLRQNLAKYLLDNLDNTNVIKFSLLLDNNIFDVLGYYCLDTMVFVPDD